MPNSRAFAEESEKRGSFARNQVFICTAFRKQPSLDVFWVWDKIKTHQKKELCLDLSNTSKNSHLLYLPKLIIAKIEIYQNNKNEKN